MECLQTTTFATTDVGLGLLAKACEKILNKCFGDGNSKKISFFLRSEFFAQNLASIVGRF